MIMVVMVMMIIMRHRKTDERKRERWNNETHETLFEKEGSREGRGEWKGEPVQRTLTHVWNYHSEIPLCYQYILLQKQNEI
jgi:hypothetical protein